MKKLILTLILFLSLSSIIQAAQTDYSAGQTNNAFLNIGVSPRAIAMGAAFSGIADDVSSLYWNPAGLSKVKQAQVLLMHNQWFQEVLYEYGAFGLPLPIGSLAASFTYVHYGTFDRIDEFGQFTGEFSVSEMGIALGYGLELTENFCVGIGVKTPLLLADGETQFSFATDVGVLYEIPSLWGLRMGMNIQNVGTEAGGGKQPSNVKLGVGLLGITDGLKLGVEADKGWYEDGIEMKVGGEYWIQGQVAPRVGYKYNISEEGLGASYLTGLTAGLGLRYSFGEMVVELDYAYVPYGDLGDTHQVGVMLEIGQIVGSGGRAAGYANPIQGHAQMKAAPKPQYALREVKKKAKTSKIKLLPPTQVSARRMGRKVKLTWGSSTSPRRYGYNVYLRSGKRGKYNKLNVKPIKANSYTTNKLIRKRTYYFMVCTVDAAGNLSKGKVSKKIYLR